MLPPPKALSSGNPAIVSSTSTPAVVLPTVSEPAPGLPALSSSVCHCAATVVADPVLVIGTSCRAAADQPVTSGDRHQETVKVVRPEPLAARVNAVRCSLSSTKIPVADHRVRGIRAGRGVGKDGICRRERTPTHSRRG